MDSPGALVQMDSKHVALGNGKVVYQFGAVDYFTRKRVVALAPRLTSHHGAEFLRQVVTQFPFQVQAIQSDGGSEFLKEFGAAIAELQLTHYFNRPNYPQGNGRVERSFRTDEEEFYQVEDLPTDLGRAGAGSPGLEPHLRDSALHIKPWAKRPQTSSITTGSILMPHGKGGLVRYLLTPYTVW